MKDDPDRKTSAVAGEVAQTPHGPPAHAGHVAIGEGARERFAADADDDAGEEHHDDEDDWDAIDDPFDHRATWAQLDDCLDALELSDDDDLDPDDFRHAADLDDEDDR